MPYSQTVMPQFRDADEDGLIGIRGCMRAFQAIHIWYIHSVNKGNDVLPETHGAVCLRWFKSNFSHQTENNRHPCRRSAAAGRLNRLSCGRPLRKSTPFS